MHKIVDFYQLICCIM